MNNTFHAKRFIWLFRKSLMERPTQMFGFTGLLLALILILYSISKALLGFGAAQNLSFIWGLAGGGCILASFVFSYFSTNASGSSYLTLPASHFEKWFCGILIVGIIYPCIFLLFFRAMDFIFVSVYHSQLDPESPYYKSQYELANLFPFDGMIARKVYWLFVFLAGSMLLGSFYFNKVSFIKVALVVAAVCIGGTVINWLMAKAIFDNATEATPFHKVVIQMGKEYGSVLLPETADRLFNLALTYIFPGLLWLLTFIRLREKEF